MGLVARHSAGDDKDRFICGRLGVGLARRHSAASIGTLSKKRRSRRRGGQQQNFYSKGIEAG